MFKYHHTKGFFVAIDGPNGSGKSTLVEEIKAKMELEQFEVYVTREPSDSELGTSTRNFSEFYSGKTLACLIAADRYEHILTEILPELNKGKIVITDRYILSSLILQRMDDVDTSFILALNSEIIKPDLQIAVFADEAVLQKRLSTRDIRTRFEKGNQSYNEIQYMKKGILELQKREIEVLQINNNNNREENVKKIISYLIQKQKINKELFY